MIHHLSYLQTTNALNDSKRQWRCNLPNLPLLKDLQREDKTNDEINIPCYKVATFFTYSNPLGFLAFLERRVWGNRIQKQATEANAIKRHHPKHSHSCLRLTENWQQRRTCQCLLRDTHYTQNWLDVCHCRGRDSIIFKPGRHYD